MDAGTMELEDVPCELTCHDPCPPYSRSCKSICLMRHTGATAFVYRENVDSVRVCIYESENWSPCDHVFDLHQSLLIQRRTHRAGRLFDNVHTSWRVATSGYPLPCSPTTVVKHHCQRGERPRLTVIMMPWPGKSGCVVNARRQSVWNTAFEI